MKVLVCGGAGYIGAQMCRILAEHGHQPVTLDNLSTGHREAVRWGPLVVADLLDTEALARAFAAHGPFEAVMHFCARSIVSESVAEPLRYFRNNVLGTLALLEASVAHAVPYFLFSSSAAVYGAPRYTPIDEHHPCEPLNPYGHTKLAVEKLLAHYEAVFGLRYVALRYFNAAGASRDGTLGEDHEPETHLIPNVLRAAMGAHRLRLYGDDYDTPDGTCIRDYIHVEDLCEAHLAALNYLARGGTERVFNLGSGQGYSVLEVIRCAERVTGRPIPFERAPRRPGDPPVLVAAFARAEGLLGWRPRQHALEDIVASAWRWHQRRAAEARAAFSP
jgi:UDP-glucose-4-epimerase GalE